MDVTFIQYPHRLTCRW